PSMRTRFQRAVERCATRTLAGFVERVNFGVRLACPFVRAIADDYPLVGDDTGANDRIGSRPAKTAPCLLQGPAHPPNVVLCRSRRNSDGSTITHHFSWKSASTYSCAENGIKSSIASPMPTYRIGSLRSFAIATATPPLAVPSSFVRTMPVTPATDVNS